MKEKIGSALIFIGSLMTVACERLDSPFLSTGRGDVEGCLVSNEGLPVAGAVVSTDPEIVGEPTTNTEGKYSLEAVPAGKVTIIAIGADRSRWETTVIVAGGGRHTLDCLRPSAPLTTSIDGVGTIAGCLTTPDGARVPQAWVWQKDQFTVGAARANDEGCFRLEKVTAGAVTLLASSPDFALGGTFEVAAAPSRTIDVGERMLETMGCVSGEVDLIQGGVSPPVEISVVESPFWTWSRADGTFAVPAPRGSCFELRAEAVNMENANIERACPELSCDARENTHAFAMRSLIDPEPFVYVELEPMLQPAAWAAVAIDGTRLYSAGGQFCRPGGPEPGEAPCSLFESWQSAAFQEYDFSTGHWTMDPAAQLRFPRAGAVAGTLDGKLYVAGGFHSVPRTYFNGEEVAVCGLFENFLDYGEECSECGGNLRPAQCPLELVDRFDPVTRTWEFAYFSDRSHRWVPLSADGPPQLPLGTAWGTLAANRRALYLVGGITSQRTSNDTGYLGDIQYLIQGELRQWSRHQATLGYPAYFVSACTYANHLFATGGTGFKPDSTQVDANCFRPVHIFDFAGADWLSGIREAPANYQNACVVLGHHLYTWGHGVKDDPVGSHNAEYDILRGSWRLVHELGPESTGSHQIRATPHGFVLLAGGTWNEASQTTSVYAAVATRFVDRALARYARGIVETEVVEPGEIPPLPDDLEAMCAAPAEE